MSVLCLSRKLQVVSVLLNESDASSAVGNDADFAGKNGTFALLDASSAVGNDADFAGKNGTLALLGSLANAVAVGAEAGEIIGEVRAGFIALQVRWELALSGACTSAEHSNVPLVGGAFMTTVAASRMLVAASRMLSSLPPYFWLDKERTRKEVLLRSFRLDHNDVSFLSTVVRVCPTHHQAAKIAGSSIPGTMVTVGEKGVHVSFQDWVFPVNDEDDSTIVAAVTTLGVSEPEGGQTRFDKLCVFPGRCLILRALLATSGLVLLLSVTGSACFGRYD